MSVTPCHACGASKLHVIADFENLHRVTSDCRPWPGHGELAVCEVCGLVQKPVSASWRKDAAEIYADYHMYHQATGEAEQKVVSDGGFERRSDVLLNWAKGRLPLSATGRYLDFGCGNGATLRSAANALHGWDLYGYEPHVRNREAILSIPGIKGLLSSLDDTHVSFDLITMMHVVEHIPDPSSVLREVAKKLSPGGRLFIQVPYFIDSPYELTVADHCSHFTVQTLAHVVARAGLNIISASSDVLKREITLVATLGGDVVDPASYVQVDVETMTTAATNQVTWLARVVDDTRSVIYRPFGIFGTAIAGSWLYSHLSEMIDFFVDEDANRAGHKFLGHPVYLPSEVPKGATIYIALIPDIARMIRDRHTSPQATWRAPPHWSRPEIDIR